MLLDGYLGVIIHFLKKGAGMKLNYLMVIVSAVLFLIVKMDAFSQTTFTTTKQDSTQNNMAMLYENIFWDEIFATDVVPFSEFVCALLILQQNFLTKPQFFMDIRDHIAELMLSKPEGVISQKKIKYLNDYVEESITQEELKQVLLLLQKVFCHHDIKVFKTNFASIVKIFCSKKVSEQDIYSNQPTDLKKELLEKAIGYGTIGFWISEHQEQGYALAKKVACYPKWVFYIGTFGLIVLYHLK
jgi:hypothetical protein